MQTDSFALFAKITLFILGASSFIIFWLSGARKYYLLYLGFGFCGLGISLFFSVQFMRYTALLLTLYSFVVAIIEGIKDTKENLIALQKEQTERETAFAELQSALIAKENGVTETKESE